MVQRQVASNHGWLVILSRPGRSGGDEQGVEAIGGCVHKRRALNTRLSSGTSAGTFACPAGPYRICRGEAGTKNEPNWYFVSVQKKGSDTQSSHFEPKISWISFSRNSGPPVRSKQSYPAAFYPPLSSSHVAFMIESCRAGHIACIILWWVKPYTNESWMPHTCSGSQVQRFFGGWAGSTRLFPTTKWIAEFPPKKLKIVVESAQPNFVSIKGLSRLNPFFFGLSRFNLFFCPKNSGWASSTDKEGRKRGREGNEMQI